jgi:hypothetical protein
MIRSYDVKQVITAELERAKRELRANLGLISEHSPAHVPIQTQMRAIDTELSERAGNQQASGDAPVTTGVDRRSPDPLAVLSGEYGAQWRVWQPGRYVADHRHLDVTLISDTISGLADKLRTFTELVSDLP